MNAAVLYILLIFTEVDSLGIHQTYTINGMTMHQCEAEGERIATSLTNISNTVFSTRLGGKLIASSWECKNDNIYSL